MHLRRSTAATLVGWLSLVPLTALAANPKVSALLKEGNRLYKDNKYREAAEALKQAHHLQPAPVLLYNIGRAYDQAGELQLALEYYQKFTEQKDPDPTLLKKGQLAIERLRGLLAQGAPKPASPEKPPETSRGLTSAPRLEEAGISVEMDGKAQKRMAAAWVAGGVGAAALGMGIGFGLASMGSKSAFNKAVTFENKVRFQRETTGRAWAADISFVVAVAAAITTIAILPKGPSSVSSPALELTVTPLANGGYAQMGTHF